jgi:hypothetical protein
MLLKPQVYRHVLKNMLDSYRVNYGVCKLAVVWLSLDICMRRFRWINFFGRPCQDPSHMLWFAFLSMAELIAYAMGIYIGTRLHTKTASSLR